MNPESPPMVYMLATLANDAEQMPSLLHALAASDPAPPARGAETWGVGYYADDRALITKKPARILGERSVYELAPEVRSRIVLACTSSGGDRDLAAPFRFRRWIFGWSGDLSPLTSLQETVVDNLPDFIRSGIRESSPGGLAFGMFLSELHRANLLEDPLSDGQALGVTLAKAVDTIRRLSEEAEGGPARASIVASNGRVLLVSNAGAPLSRKRQEGLERLPEGPPDPALTDFKELAGALKRFQAVVLAPGEAGGRPGWEDVREGETLVIDGRLGVTSVSA